MKRLIPAYTVDCCYNCPYYDSEWNSNIRAYDGGCFHGDKEKAFTRKESDNSTKEVCFPDWCPLEKV